MQREWRPDWPCPAGQILAVARRGPGDPSYRIDPAGAHWRGVRTPLGPGALRVEARAAEATVLAQAWGPGAEWLLDRVPTMLGADDDWDGFEARHPVLEDALRRNPHWRIGRTGLVMEALVPAVLEQKVTGQEAFLGFRRLVRGHGERAPGPHDDLWLQPTPEVLAAIPSWEWLRMRVDGARSRAVVTAARVAASLERTTAVTHDEADRRLRSLPGIGIWTSAETRVRAHGDPDAVSFGDFHVAKDIGWALRGRPADDAELAEILQEWAGHRYRVQALLSLGGHRRPRRGPRMAPRGHLPG
ncbi:DNA-3-methyladenine glycosylase 2 family protein [Nocardioides sp. JQ2195]|uniref:DNA-3-methyladenine glycosylase family protein n=1 Tax=Nocardioides sp. JQ2195 TaxID=2592334 RepID=UPI00143E239C|nr:DNA-3-methyladenine glycosylase 2 family protein [Nocardioides sp. JQ2195]QIX26602.1 DNA-3-methyladenine glycosylase 2 family protein [Nocardioides sp. JQ2195]